MYKYTYAYMLIRVYYTENVAAPLYLHVTAFVHAVFLCRQLARKEYCGIPIKVTWESRMAFSPSFFSVSVGSAECEINTRTHICAFQQFVFPMVHVLCTHN